METTNLGGASNVVLYRIDYVHHRYADGAWNK